ncbi:hypothetical protein N9N28_15335, partial [Rubripirellula amarantea]|nr:hypothetical protein [Rubripirellula amarantea]
IQIRFSVTPGNYTGEPGGEECFLVYTLDGRGNPVFDLYFSEYCTELDRSADDIASASGRVETLINPGAYVTLPGLTQPLPIIGITAVARASVPTVVDTWLPAGTDAIQVQIDSSNLHSLSARKLDRFANSASRFSITRTPRAAIAAPITLPRGTSIDLTSSGVGRAGLQFSPMVLAALTVPGTTTPNYLDTTALPLAGGPLDFQSVYVMFGRRGEVNRVFAGGIEIPVTGDIYFLVSEAAEVKTDPDEQLEDDEADPLNDSGRDGTTPLLNREAIWVAIQSTSGQVTSSAWTDPTPADDPSSAATRRRTFLIPAKQSPVPSTLAERNLEQYQRIGAVAARTRSGVVNRQSQSN